MAEAWIRTDEAEDVAGSVRHALFSRTIVTDDAHSWKWIVLALHSALQGACVCHLTTSSSPFGAVTKKNGLEWLAYFDDVRTDTTAKPPKTQLMSLPALLKSVRKPHSAGDRSNSQGIEISNSELRWLCRLHSEVRNQFVHFAPTGWSLEVSGIPDFASTVARIINDISEIGYAFRRCDQLWRQSLKLNLDELTTWSVS